MLIALRVTAVLHAVAYAVQPILAGMFLSGRDNAIGSHGDNAAIVSTLALVLAVMAAVARRKRLAGPYVLPIAATVFVLEIVQLTAGMDHVMWLHIPLGVGLFAAVIATLPLVLAAKSVKSVQEDRT
ncbi:hypothetical protein DI272_38150 [Streptomyces sp. Act143]|uniref:hypothetical protein n=1 Tax=Streptomyces sp. Act143 TaxID=2200760 RepID=UPI000D6773FE|nr:hypothetical protein [Streptomyces sp. Act143]PWI19337.1 hypothetical protein DI272_38150 [Streptomyces sp. Act143]